MTLRTEAACLYGTAILAAVIWFDVRTGGLSGTALVLIPYVSVILFTSLCAYQSGESYVNRTKSKVHFLGIIFVPLRIIIYTSLLTSVLLMVAFFIWMAWEEGLGLELDEDMVAFPIFMVMYFGYVSWPVLVAGLLAASLVLVARTKVRQRDGAL